jgi:hypothetical protein
LCRGKLCLHLRLSALSLMASCATVPLEQTGSLSSYEGLARNDGLLKSFAADFSQLLVTGSSPFGTLPSLPSLHSIGSLFGGAPKEAACERFGRAPGLPGLIGDSIGLPPEWTDKGAPANAQTSDSSKP